MLDLYGREWLDGDGGKKDMEGSIFTEEGVVYRGPRYSFFLFVDEESLESVVDEEKAKEEDLDEDDRERELEDVRKRVKVNALVGMYAWLRCEFVVYPHY